MVHDNKSSTLFFVLVDSIMYLYNHMYFSSSFISGKCFGHTSLFSQLMVHEYYVVMNVSRNIRMKSYAEGYEPSQHNPIQFILHIRHVHKSIVQMYIYSIFSYTQTTYSRSGFYLSSDQEINIATCVSCKTLLLLTRKDPVYQILIGPNLLDDLIFFRSDNNRSD